MDRRDMNEDKRRAAIGDGPVPGADRTVGAAARSSASLRAPLVGRRGAGWWAALVTLLVAVPALAQVQPDRFHEQVDLSPLDAVAVHHEGRLKSFESFARSMMHHVSGPHEINGQAAAFTYLDLMFRQGLYTDADIIYVKKKHIRAQIAEALRRSLASEMQRRAAEAGAQTQLSTRLNEILAGFMEHGLISPAMLTDPAVQDLLQRMQQDLIRTAKFANAIETALAVSQPQVLRGQLRLVPPPSGGFDQPWITIDELAQAPPASDFAAMSADVRSGLQDAWATLQRSWRQSDAAGVNEAVARLGSLLPQVNAEIYPASDRLAWESWYFRAKNLTWIWVIYALALVPLLASIVFRWRGARWAGLGLFLIAFALHTFAIYIRWEIAGRWPNSNMFEAVTTAAWFGGVCALVLEAIARRTPMRNLFALGSAAASMVAMMAAYYNPVGLNPNISNMMPVLHDLWLYIHTNVIIFSYCLIFMAAVTAAAYLAYRFIGSFAGFGGPEDHARVGGAGTLMLAGAGGSNARAQRSATTLGQVLDGTTMVVLELAFVMLFAGIVMGAIWADHSWGRPWGWDPKEVFAVNTLLVFIILIHLRLKVRDKGLWTAVLAVVGALVMLFNWIAINFVITGLHSYA